MVEVKKNTSCTGVWRRLSETRRMIHGGPAVGLEKEEGADKGEGACEATLGAQDFNHARHVTVSALLSLL
jgi:hypothetical protein